MFYNGYPVNWGVIRAIVTSNPDRDQANYPEHPFKLDHHVTELVGLCGEVWLYRKARS